MTKVFVSHSTKDQAFVEREIIDVLHQQGVGTWYSTDDINSSAQWERCIIGGLESCDWFLVVLSPQSAVSDWVRDEVHWAMEKRPGRIIPVLVEDCDPLSFHLRMSRIQHIDFRRDVETARRKLLEVLGIDSVDSMSPGDAKPEAAESVKVPSFHFGGVVPPEFFIGRTEELQQAEFSVCSQNNLLLVGELRAGKTSFGKMLIHRIMGRPNNKVLGAYLNVQQWPELNVKTFFEHTILALVGEVARQVFEINFTALRGEDPAGGRGDLEGDQAFASFLDVYRDIRSRTHTQGVVVPDAFRIEEFTEANRELMTIIRSRGWSHCFVFYDEANRLGREQSVDMLLSHQEALSLSGLTAVYAASPTMVDSSGALQDWFVEKVELGPFCNQKEMRRLLARYYVGDAKRWHDVPARSDALDRLWALSQGMPFRIQLIAGRSFALARKLDDKELLVCHVTEAHAQLLREKPTAFTTGGD